MSLTSILGAWHTSNFFVSEVVRASIIVCVSLFKLRMLCCSSKCPFLYLCWLMSKNFKLISDFVVNSGNNSEILMVGVVGERAKRARHYQGCTNSSWCSKCIYTYVWRYVWHNSTACHVYVMWAEIGHSHFLYVPAISNVITLEMAPALKMF